MAAPVIVDDLSPLAGQEFATIYGDPPWRYDNRASRGAAENHYPTMTVDEICAEPVADLAADRAHLHLWTTNSFLLDALRVIEAWGFTYADAFVWCKPQMGAGNYWRLGHEILLLGVRGDLPFASNEFASWMVAPRTKHSRKPEKVRRIIQQVSPGPYLELYGRGVPPDDWTVYGNEVELSPLFAGLDPIDDRRVRT